MAATAKVVYFNDGTDPNVPALVRSVDGTKRDLAVCSRDGVHYEDGVPRREPKDYGPEGGGRTWHA